MTLDSEEHKFIEKILYDLDDGCIIFDVGVNEGEHLDIFLNKLKDFKLYAFEPNEKTYKSLTEKYKQKNIIINHLGLDDVVNENKDFYRIKSTFSRFEGLSSCFFRKDIFNKLEYEKLIIKCDTIDNFCKNNNINEISFLKIDTEGNELNILKGAKEFLQSKKIKYIQFEYGLCWKDAEMKIKDCLKLLNGFGYKVYTKDFKELTNSNDDYEINTCINYFSTYKDLK